MGETIQTTRVYFVVLGILGVLLSAWMIGAFVSGPNVKSSAHEFWSPIFFAILTIRLLVSIAYIWSGIKLPALLTHSPRVVSTILLIGAAWYIVIELMLFLMRPDLQAASWVKVLIWLGISWYMWRNVVRLAANAGRGAQGDQSNGLGC